MFILDMNNYDSRKIARVEPEENNGIGVSTAYTSDEGYETALFDSNGVHPVERYGTKEKAEKGHKKWVDFAKEGNGKKVIKLGWSAFNNMNEEIFLKAEPSNLLDQ
ncbi:MAG: hypothetical protein ACFFG0_05425 [Candidatus Thorarchaeota archaeon]